MSSSLGSPSNKIGWFKSMTDKLNHEQRIEEEAKRVAKSPSYKPRYKGGKKADKLFAESLEFHQKLESKRKKRETKTTKKELKNEQQ